MIYILVSSCARVHLPLLSLPTRRSSDLTQPVLLQMHQVAGGVGGVHIHERGDQPGHARTLQSSERGRQFVGVSGGGDQVQIQRQRLGAARFDSLGVHEGCVHGGDLGGLAAGRVIGGYLGRLGDQLPHVLLGLVVQLVERAVPAAVGGDLVGGQPGAVDVPEEVVLGTYGGAHGGRVAILGGACGFVARGGGGGLEAHAPKIPVSGNRHGIGAAQYVACASTSPATTRATN